MPLPSTYLPLLDALSTGEDNYASYFGISDKRILSNEELYETCGEKEADKLCSMGVGCGIYGVCFAEAHGHHELCGKRRDWTPTQK